MTTRPLKDLSTFAVTELHKRLKTDPASLPANVSLLAESLSESVLGQAYASQRILASLDLKMLEVALAHLGSEVPEKLAQLIGYFSPSCPGLLYEEIICENPSDDLRTFTGEVVEMNFYTRHRRIEEQLGRVLHAVKALLAGENEAWAIEELLGFTTMFNDIHRSTAALGNMPKGAFPTFRKFLSVHPVHGTNGPSGFHSARFHTFELLTVGRQMADDFEEYIRTTQRNWIHLPTRDHADLEEAIARACAGETLVAHCQTRNYPAAVVASIYELRDFFGDFRKVHYRAVEKQAPEALSGKVAGTGGVQDVDKFLKARMGVHH